jgi:hypothetical protein
MHPLRGSRHCAVLVSRDVVGRICRFVGMMPPYIAVLANKASFSNSTYRQHDPSNANISRRSADIEGCHDHSCQGGFHFSPTTMTLHISFDNGSLTPCGPGHSPQKRLRVIHVPGIHLQRHYSSTLTNKFFSTIKALRGL